MRKRISLLLLALMLALTMSVGSVAFAAKTTTFEKGSCTTTAGMGGGGGEVKDQHHGQCGSNGASF